MEFKGGPSYSLRNTAGGATTYRIRLHLWSLFRYHPTTSSTGRERLGYISFHDHPFLAASICLYENIRLHHYIVLYILTTYLKKQTMYAFLFEGINYSFWHQWGIMPLFLENESLDVPKMFQESHALFKHD